MPESIYDPLFRVERLAATPNPQQACWQAMHQDYSENFVADEPCPEESKAGEICVKRLLAGERGHYGPLEHPQITFATGFFPHSVMQQARTHRVGVSFDVQSMRYTGDRVYRFIQESKAVCPQDLSLDHPWFTALERLFYVRPVGSYVDRQGKRYYYTNERRKERLIHCYDTAIRYTREINLGVTEEDARGVLAFDYRQHFVVSFSLRALLHFLDLRAKLDAQLEIRALCDLMWPHLEAWAPEIAAWYKESRLHRARLAP